MSYYGEQLDRAANSNEYIIYQRDLPTLNPFFSLAGQPFVIGGKRSTRQTRYSPGSTYVQIYFFWV